MTAPVLIFLFISSITLLMSLWAIASSIFGASDHKNHQFVLGACTTGLLAATASVCAATMLGLPRLSWAAALLAPLALGICWANVVTLRDLPGIAKFVATPIALYNLLLIAVYFTWFTTECIGLDFGTWSAALLGGTAQAQTLVGHPEAAENPLWFYLPLAIPLWRGLRALELAALMMSAVVSSFMLLVFVLVMPLSFQRAESYRDLEPVTPRRLTSLGLEVPWGDQKLSELQRTRIRIRIQQTHAELVTFRVGEETFTDDALRRQVAEELEWAKDAKLQTLAVTKPPRAAAKTPYATLAELRSAMVRTQSLTAQTLRPTWLVLYAGPFGRLRACTKDASSPRDWYRAIRETTQQVKPVAGTTKFVVSLERFSVRSEELYGLLESAKSPVDAIGIAVRPNRRPMSEITADLARFDSWTRESAGHRPVLITECRFPVQLLGGETAQWNLFSRVMAFADDAPIIRALSLNALYDPHRDVGIINRTGRRRLAFEKLRETLPSPARRSAKPGR